MTVPQPNRVSSGAPGEMGFDLCIDPNPRFVSIVRRFVEAALDRLVCDPEVVFRISMSAHELMENAVKYSIGNRTVLRVTYQRSPDDAGARVSLYLSNETTPEHIDRLKVRVQAITDAADPFMHYQSLMRQNARAVDESGLGLARIRAEGEMDLGLEVRGNTVALLADARLAKESLR
jgi:hypothetical protein